MKKNTGNPTRLFRPSERLILTHSWNQVLDKMDVLLVSGRQDEVDHVLFRVMKRLDEGLDDLITPAK